MPGLNNKRRTVGPRGGFNPGHPRKLKVRVQELRALGLRLDGKSYDDIGDALGITGVHAHRIIMQLLDRYDAELAEKVPQARRQEIERCRKMLVGLAPGIKKGVVGAILAGLKVSERLSKLQGLDVPVKVDVEHSGAVTVDAFRKMLADDGIAGVVADSATVAATNPVIAAVAVDDAEAEE